MLFKQFIRSLKTQYLLFWLLPILLVAGYESNLMPVGVYADDPAMQYALETAAILITLICVPLALKLFNLVLRKKIDRMELNEALRKYTLWSGLRLGILGVALLVNIVIYYSTLSNVGSFCALIVLTASLFCLPGGKRLREELNVVESPNKE